MTRISGVLVAIFPANSFQLIALQIAAILLIALVAGATFGIWRGYNPATFSALTFLEMHKGAVDGLNTLLPVTALSALILSAILYLRGLADGGANHLTILAIALIIAGGLVTRFGNQPINADVVTWTVETMPANWQELRDNWWTWHVVRTGFSIAALTFLLAAVLIGRGSSR